MSDDNRHQLEVASAKARLEVASARMNAWYAIFGLTLLICLSLIFFLDFPTAKTLGPGLVLGSVVEYCWNKFRHG